MQYLVSSHHHTSYVKGEVAGLTLSLVSAGGTTPTLRILSTEAPFFTGCMENVVVDGVELVPGKVSQQRKVSGSVTLKCVFTYWWLTGEKSSCILFLYPLSSFLLKALTVLVFTVFSVSSFHLLTVL